MFVEIFLPPLTANVAYFQRKIQLSGFSAYPDGSPSLLNRISVVPLYYIFTARLEDDPKHSKQCPESFRST